MTQLFSQFDALVVFDTETTGFNPKYEEIIEIGAIRLRREGMEFVPDQELSCLIQLPAGRCVPEKIVELTGITQDMLDHEGIERREAAQKLHDLLSGEKVLCAAYNAQFDLNFVYYFLARFGFADCLKSLRFFDALTVYRDRRPYPHRLCNAIEAYQLGDEAVNSHRAVDDAKATLLLMQAMAEERDDLSAYVNLFGFHPKYGVSGQKISSIQYLPQSLYEHPPLYEMAKQQA